MKLLNCNAVFFKVKKTTPFKNIFDAYLQRVGQTSASVKFVFEGQRVLDTQSPLDLEMEEEDTVDAVIRQTGG